MKYKLGLTEMATYATILHDMEKNGTDVFTDYLESSEQATVQALLDLLGPRGALDLLGAVMSSARAQALIDRYDR